MNENQLTEAIRNQWGAFNSKQGRGGWRTGSPKNRKIERCRVTLLSKRDWVLRRT